MFERDRHPLIKISAAGSDKVREDGRMFNGASAFDQDLGWCVKDMRNAVRTKFPRDQVRTTRSCGVRRAGKTHATKLPYSTKTHRPSCPSCLLRRMRLLLSEGGRNILRRGPPRPPLLLLLLLLTICCRKKKEKSSNSQPDASVVAADGCRVPANAPLVGVLKELSSFAFRERDEVRGGAYNKAAAALRMHSVVITSGKEAKKLDGIGKSIARTIDEFLDKGTVQKLEDYKDRRGPPSRRDHRLPPDSPAESPRDDPDEEATAPSLLETRAAAKAEAAETVERPGFTKSLSSFLFGEQEEAPQGRRGHRPVRRGSRGGSNRAATAASPAKRWFSREPNEHRKPRKWHQRMAGRIMTRAGSAALRAAWGEYPGTSDALQDVARLRPGHQRRASTPSWTAKRARARTSSAHYCQGMNEDSWKAPRSTRERRGEPVARARNEWPAAAVARRARHRLVPSAMPLVISRAAPSQGDGGAGEVKLRRPRRPRAPPPVVASHRALPTPTWPLSHALAVAASAPTVAALITRRARRARVVRARPPRDRARSAPRPELANAFENGAPRAREDRRAGAPWIRGRLPKPRATRGVLRRG